MPGPTERSDDTRRHILDAAQRVFLEHGFSGARVEQVASAAHVGVGTIYLHFRNKDGLYTALLTRAQSMLIDDYLLPVFAAGGPPWARIRAWCLAYTRFTVDHPELARLMPAMQWTDATRPPEFDQQLRGRVVEAHRLLEALFEEAAARDELAGADPVTASRFVWWAMFGIAAQNVRHPDFALDGDDLARLVSDGVRMLSGGRAGSQIEA